ncbi:MAG: hypothetical protein JTT11_00020 [Candidatus Brockarchaeota archaeon]|nr:hypothetical protein [Candidatus Brockarchaeota archaeon]
MLSGAREIVALVLKDVMYRSSEYRTLEEFLIGKYGFRKVEEEEHEIRRLKQVMRVDKTQFFLKDELSAPVVSEETEKEFSSMEILEGFYLDAGVRVYVLGDVTRTEDIVEAGGDEKYPVYTATYQMVKLVSESGYAIQQLIERLGVDLGLRIERKDWFFHKCGEG